MTGRTSRDNESGAFSCGRGDEMLRSVLEALVQLPDRVERVGFGRRLVEAEVGDSGEAQREAGLVAIRAEDDVEGDLDDHQRVDQPVAAVLADRVLLEPAGHRRNL